MMILIGPFQLSIFYDSIMSYVPYPTGYKNYLTDKIKNKLTKNTFFCMLY